MLFSHYSLRRILLLSGAFSMFSTTVFAESSIKTKPANKILVSNQHNSGKLRKKKALVASAEEAVGVVGHRVTRGAITNISTKVFKNAIAGTSVLKAMQNVPGVLFQSDDAQGVDTGGVRLYIHGFSLNQIGFSLDGIPLGESVYRNYNGLNLIAAISSENVGRMDMSQGSGAVDMPSTNLLGGALRVYSSDPKDKLGGTLAATGGSNATTHAYMRFDSGILNSSGTKFYASYMRNNTELWKGVGEQFVQQVNTKLVQPIGHDSKVSVFFDYSDVQQANYQTMTLEMVNKLGYGVANYYPNYRLAYLSAQGIYSHGEDRVASPRDVSYYSVNTSAKDYLGGINGHFRLADKITLDSVVYGHGEDSIIQAANPYFPSANGAPLSQGVNPPTIRRLGLTSGVTYELNKHHIHAGLWYENNKYTSDSYGYNLPVLSGNENITVNPYQKWRDPFTKFFGETYNTNTLQTYIEDTYHPLRNLSFQAGFKSLLNTTRVSATGNNPDYTGTDAIAGGEGLTTFGAFLPHFSGDWHFKKHHELYFDIAKNMRAYPQSGFNFSSSPFAVTQSAFSSTRNQIKPETSWSYSAGYRVSYPFGDFSLNGYHVNFSNRLGALMAGSQLNPQTTVLNLGGVTMNGVDAGLTIRPVPGLSIFNSVSYNHSTYDGNITQLGDIYQTKGKKVVNYPSFVYKSSADYEYKHASLHVEASYTGKREFSYTNDSSVPGYWLVDLGLRYNFGRVGRMENLQLSFNVTNLTGSRYLMFIGDDGGNPLSGDYQSLVVGAPRQFFGGLRADF